MGRARRRARRGAARRPTGSTSARHHLRTARRYRPHLLTEPEEQILAEKAVTGRGAWARLFDELTSARSRSTLDGEDEPVALEEALAPPDVARPRGAPRRGRSASPTALRARRCARAASSSTRCWPTRPPTTGCAATRTGSSAATSPTRRATSRCRRSSTPCASRYDIPQRWYRLKAQLLGLDRLADYDRMASVGRRRGRRSAGPRRARLVLDAYADFSPELADVRPALLRRALDRRAGAPGQARRRVLRLHRAERPPLPAAQLDRQAPRRAHARPRARPRRARLPGARPGRLPPGHAADAGRDGVGVRRDARLRPPARRRRRRPTARLALLAESSRARSPPCSARSR